MSLTKKRKTALLVVVLCIGSLSISCDRRDSAGSAPRVVRRDPQSTPGSGPTIGVRREIPRDNGDPGMLELIESSLGNYAEPIAFLGERADGDQRFGRFEKQIRAIAEAPFDTRSTDPALQELSKMKAGYLLVTTMDPRIDPWPTDDLAKVRHSLRDGVPPPGFQPVVIGRAHILYRIAPSLTITKAQRRTITAYLRARLTEREERPELDLPPDAAARAPDGKVRIILSLRLPGTECSRGRHITRRTGQGTTIRAALDDAYEQVRDNWRRNRRRSRCREQLPEQLREAMARITLQIEVIHRLAAISDRTENRLFYLIELGREGAYIKRGDVFRAISPHHTVHRSIANETHLVERVGSWNDLDEDAWQDEQYQFGRFETIAWVEQEPGERTTELYRGVPLVSVNSITSESLVESLVLGAQFLVRSQTKQGEYRYYYRPLRDRGRRWSEDNNIVRHALCPMVVAKAHQAQPDPALQASAKRGIDFTLSFLERTGDRCAIEYQGSGADRPNRKMGTVAATVLSILVLGRTTDIEEYRDELQCLGNQIVAMQEDSGRFTHYDVPVTHPYRGRHNTIYPGELMFALSMLYEWSGEERYRQAFDRAMDYQRAWFRQTRSETREDGIYDERRRVDLISFEPWGIMAVNDMHRQVGDQRYADFAFELVEFMDGMFHWDIERAQYADYLGGYFKTQLEAPAINSCGYTEGAAAAFAIALRSGQRIEERRRSLLIGLRFVLQLQYHPERSTFYVPDPETASGGFRYNLTYSRIRNDYMYHALNALAMASFSLRDEDFPPNVTFENSPDILAPAFVTD